jgi:hypothetical protein
MSAEVVEHHLYSSDVWPREPESIILNQVTGLKYLRFEAMELVKVLDISSKNLQCLCCPDGNEDW